MITPIESTLAVSGLFGFVVGMVANRPVLGAATSTVIALSNVALDTLLGENFTRTVSLQLCVLTVILLKAGRLENGKVASQRQRIKVISRC